MSTAADATVVPLKRVREAGKEVPLLAAVTDALGRVSDKARSAAQGADEFVRENPWRAAALVAVVGLCVGFAAAWSARARGGASRSGGEL